MDILCFFLSTPEKAYNRRNMKSNVSGQTWGPILKEGAYIWNKNKMDGQLWRKLGIVHVWPSLFMRIIMDYFCGSSSLF